MQELKLEMKLLILEIRRGYWLKIFIKSLSRQKLARDRIDSIDSKINEAKK